LASASASATASVTEVASASATASVTDAASAAGSTPVQETAAATTDAWTSAAAESTQAQETWASSTWVEPTAASSSSVWVQPSATAAAPTTGGAGSGGWLNAGSKLGLCWPNGDWVSRVPAFGVGIVCPKGKMRRELGKLMVVWIVARCSLHPVRSIMSETLSEVPSVSCMIGITRDARRRESKAAGRS
jgi:hypothetical protein